MLTWAISSEMRTADYLGAGLSSAHACCDETHNDGIRNLIVWRRRQSAWTITCIQCDASGTVKGPPLIPACAACRHVSPRACVVMLRHLRMTVLSRSQCVWAALASRLADGGALRCSRLLAAHPIRTLAFCHQYTTVPHVQLPTLWHRPLFIMIPRTPQLPDSLPSGPPSLRRTSTL